MPVGVAVAVPGLDAEPSAPPPWLDPGSTGVAAAPAPWLDPGSMGEAVAAVSAALWLDPGCCPFDVAVAAMSCVDAMTVGVAVEVTGPDPGSVGGAAVVAVGLDPGSEGARVVWVGRAGGWAGGW